MEPSKQKSLSSYYDEFIDPFFPAPRAFIIRAEHITRYLFARKFIKNKRLQTVYDIACGDGYGTKILSSAAKEVVGIDGKSSFISYAKKNNNGKNISYHIFDIEHADLSLPKAAGIVCFETLEHLQDGDRFIKNLSKCLSEGGYLLLSTPNAQLEPKKHGVSKNIYHKHIYYRQELIELLERNGFTIVSFYGQPITNLLLHHAKLLVEALNKLTQQSSFLFVLFARLVASPVRVLLPKSYSFIVVAVKK